jgi:hypothetical protein
MGHLQSTMRKIEEDEAAAPLAGDLSESTRTDLAEVDAKIIDLPSLPGIGTNVSFRLRGGEYRNGAQDFAAIVTRVHGSGLIDIVVVLGADDVMDQQNVPRRAADGDWGWSPIENGALVAVERLRSDFEAFKVELAEVIFGQFPKAKESIYDVLQEMDNRLNLLAPAEAPARASNRRRRAKG